MDAQSTKQLAQRIVRISLDVNAKNFLNSFFYVRLQRNIHVKGQIFSHTFPSAQSVRLNDVFQGANVFNRSSVEMIKVQSKSSPVKSKIHISI
jgi:hypothetical protein